MDLWQRRGYEIAAAVFTQRETEALSGKIQAADTNGAAFRRSGDLFAIRRFLEEVPGIKPLVFNEKLRALLQRYAGPGFFCTKAIYFDKPPGSNWFVPWHQDLTISVDRKTDMAGFGPWTKKPGQYAVQPPLPILEQNITLRIHLDDTDASNGALKVIPGSHLAGVLRTEQLNRHTYGEELCVAPQGAVMLMKPLLLHASDRSAGTKRRRVIHLEFSKAALPPGLQWSEAYHYDKDVY